MPTSLPKDSPRSSRSARRSMQAGSCWNGCTTLRKSELISLLRRPWRADPFAAWIAKLKQSGYTFHLVFLWLPSTDFAVARVAERVRMGGHHVPEETIRRRYNKGIENFFRLYRPLSVTWRLYDNSEPSWPRIVADGRGDANETIYDPKTWSLIRGGKI